MISTRTVLLLLGSLVLFLCPSALAQNREAKDMGWERTPKQEIVSKVDVNAEIRHDRGAKFDNPFAARLDSTSPANPNSDQLHVGRVIGAPLVAIPLPVCAASDVFVGTVTGFQPFLSNDHSTVYSELYVRVDEVLKSSGSERLAAGRKVVTLVHGGTLTLQTGQTVHQYGPEKSSLQPGGVYVFFARFANPTDSYEFLNLWDLSSGLAAAISDTDVVAYKRGRSLYSGLAKDKFLTEIRSMMTSCSN